MEQTLNPQPDRFSSGYPSLAVALADIRQPACVIDDSGVTLWRNGPADQLDPMTATRIPLQDAHGETLYLCLAGGHAEPAVDPLYAIATREGDHRVRNIVSLALAIGHQSLGDRLDDPVVQRYLDRLRSLDAVARVGCESAGDRCSVAMVARQVTSRFDDPEHSRITLSGPELFIPVRWAHLLAIVFHELGANAIRHGALRGRAGIVDLRWCLVVDAVVDCSTLHLTWREAGGPPIPAVRARGFGSRILRDIASVSSRCTATFRLPPTGLEYRLAIVFDDHEVSGES